jgi:hypothetical protein
VLAFDEVDQLIGLLKDQPGMHGVGSLKMRLESRNLIAGSKFMASPHRLVSIPKIGGGSPRNWEYTVYAQFDGSAPSLVIQPIFETCQHPYIIFGRIGHEQDPPPRRINSAAAQGVGAFRERTQEIALPRCVWSRS